MRSTAVAMVATALVLAGCGKEQETANAAAAASDARPAAPVSRQPGSWSTRIEVTRLDAGPGVDSAQVRQGMQAAMNAASAVSICLTPEAAARDNPAANVEQMAQGRNCTFDRRVVNGARIDIAGTCQDARGRKVRVAIAGTSEATAQDLTMTVAPVDASAAGPGPRSMEMRARSNRTGDCKPGDVTPPAPARQSS